MKDISKFAEDVVARVAGATGHSDEDWGTLAAVKHTTVPWAPLLAKEFGKLVYEEIDDAKSVVEKFPRPEREASIVVWYERLVSGAPGETFWSETALIGLYHASAGVPNELVLALVGKFEDFFLGKAKEAFPPAEAIEVYSAFRRILAVSAAVMVEAYDQAVIDGICQLGFNPKLMNRMRTIAIKKMIAKGRDTLPLMSWDDSLHVSEEIDRQHQKLLEILNRLHRSQVDGKGNDTLRDVLKELVTYTVEHFDYEEKMLEEAGYPQLPAHKESHKKLKATVSGFVDDFEAGRATLGADIFLFLRSWLNTHIRGTDRHYGQFLEKQAAAG